MEKFEIECDYSYYSDVGGRSNNEDSYLAKRLEDGCLFVVADGLGGVQDGEIASRLAVDVVKEELQKTGLVDLEKSVNRANQMILKKQKEMESPMKTTIALVYVQKYKTTIAHVGDSRIYVLKEGKIVFQSNDHSVSQLAVFMGEIEQSEVRNHEDRNKLTRALGVSEEVKVEVDVLNTQEYDSLLVCSDGFWEDVYENEMEQARTESESAKMWLYKLRNIQLERATENCDNNTAIAVIKKELAVDNDAKVL